MDEDRLKEVFKKVESVILVIFLGVMFFFGYAYDKENSWGLLICYFALFGISATMIVFGTLVMSKDEVREQYRLDRPKEMLEEAVEDIKEAIKTLKESVRAFLEGRFAEAWEKFKLFVSTRKKSVLYSPLAIFSLLGILSFFGLSVSDPERGVIPLAFSLFVVYQLQVAPMDWKKRGYIKNSLEKIEEFTEIARNSREEAERVLSECDEFKIELWEIQNQTNQTAMENIANHSEIVNTFSGTHKMRDRVAPMVMSGVGVLSWLLRMFGVGL